MDGIRIAKELTRIARALLAGADRDGFTLLTKGDRGALQLNILKKDSVEFYRSDEWKSIAPLFDGFDRSSPLLVDREFESESPFGSGYFTLKLSFANVAKGKEPKKDGDEKDGAKDGDEKDGAKGDDEKDGAGVGLDKPASVIRSALKKLGLVEQR